jgi:2-polyprenyl-3-methyl-5-hydroxy-6-metoxy-1,4-benzoquinol methylase
MAMAAADLSDQRAYWNAWNRTTRAVRLTEISERQRQVVLGWLGRGGGDLEIIDVGCGAGWMCEALCAYGKVTGTDFADEVVRQAAQRVPAARFIAADFMALDLPDESFDLVVCLEVLSHVEDQAAFIAKLARLLKPGGRLMMATQNKDVLKLNRLPAPVIGQVRRWVDRHELRAMLAPHFKVRELFTVTPMIKTGVRRVLTSRKLRRLARMIVGDRFDRALEARGWGWTMMCLAHKQIEIAPA